MARKFISGTVMKCGRNYFFVRTQGVRLVLNKQHWSCKAEFEDKACGLHKDYTCFKYTECYEEKVPSNCTSWPARPVPSGRNQTFFR